MEDIHDNAAFEQATAIQQKTSTEPNGVAPRQPDEAQNVMKASTESPATETMETLMADFAPPRPLRKHDIVDGIIADKTPEGIIISMGRKSEGIVPLREAKMLAEQDPENGLRPGSEVITLVLIPEDPSGRPVLSIDKARGEQRWRSLEQARINDETVKGKIIGSNRGGAVVDVDGVHGFIPISQLVGEARDLYQPDDADPKTGFIGLEVEFKVLEINRRRNRAIFSQRAASLAWKQKQKLQLVETLQEGEIRDGKVVGISNFGAFVDLGGGDGLIHISEMSWDAVRSPSEIVQVGQTVKVYVLKVDKESLKIALSLRRLQPEPWQNVGERFQSGDMVSGRVTKITHFGAFVRVAPGIEGLVHVSELSNEMVESPKSVLSEGDELEFKILKVDALNRRMSLSLKQVQQHKESAGVEEWQKSNTDTSVSVELSGSDNAEVTDTTTTADTADNETSSAESTPLPLAADDADADNTTTQIADEPKAKVSKADTTDNETSSAESTPPAVDYADADNTTTQIADEPKAKVSKNEEPTT